MASDQPNTIDKLSAGVAVQRTQFLYGADHERIRQIISPMAAGSPQSATGVIYYAGAIEKEIDTAANVTIIRTSMGAIGYVEERIAGTSVAATATATRNGRIFLEDHLGSTIGIMDESGAVLQRMSYDAWGRRRNVDGSDDSWTGLGTITNNQDNSGYTGHEQMDQLGLVNMNARLYDPITGRHISADPTVPDPANAQAFNRYSYVLNNALIFTDPTGLGPNAIFTTLSNPVFGFSWQVNEYEDKKNACKTEAECRQRKINEDKKNCPSYFCDVDYPNGVPVGKPDKSAKGGSNDPDADVPSWLRWLGFSHAPAQKIQDQLDEFKKLPPDERAKETLLSAAPLLAGATAGLALSKVAGASAKELNQIAHVFPRAEKNLEDLVRASGGSELNALRSVQAAANQALAKGILAPGANGVLPGAGAGAVLNVNGVSVQLIGGRVINGRVELGSFLGL